MREALKQIKKAKPKEAPIEGACVLYAQQRGWIALKMNGSGQTHYPDRLFVHPLLGQFFCEFKRPGGRVRPGQKITMALLSERGFCTVLCNNVEAFKRGIERVEDSTDNSGLYCHEVWE